MPKTYEEFRRALNDCDEAQKGPNANAVVSMTSDFEPYVLNKAVKEMPEGDILEIGSWVGGTTLVLATSLLERDFGTNHKVYTIDPLSRQVVKDYDPGLDGWFQRNNAPDIYQMFCENMKRWEVDEYVEQIRLKSEDVPQDFIKENMDKISLLWIDSDHTGATTYSELVKFAPVVKDDCYIIMHDKNQHGVAQGVQRYLNEFGDNNLFKITDVSNEWITEDVPRFEICKGWMYVLKKENK